MSKIHLSALDQDRAFAEQIKTALSGTFDSLQIITEPPAQPADLLLVIIGENWLQDVIHDPVQYALITNNLHRQDVPVVVLLREDAEAPKTDVLPEDLHGIAYMKRVNLHMDEARYQADLIQLAKTIDSHIHRHKTQAGGVPVNLILFVLIILFGLFIILVPDDEETPFLDGVNVGETISIGVAVNLNPTAAEQGNAFINGILLALETRPTVTVDGVNYPIDLVTLDTNCTSLGAVRAAEALVADPLLLGVIGPLCEVSCTASAGIYDEAGYVVISPACQTPSLTTFSTFNRTVPSQAGTAVAAAEHVQTLATPEQILVIHDEQIIARDLAQTFLAQFEVAPELISINTTQLDLDQLQQDIESRAPQILYFAGRTTTAAELRTRLSDDVTFVLALPEADYITLAGEPAEGTLAFEFIEPPLDDIAGQYAQTFGTEATSPVYAYSYDALNLLLDAIESTAAPDDDGNLIVNREVLNAAVRTYTGSGAAGELNCNNTGECAANLARIISVQDGAWTHGDGLLD